MSRLGLTLRRSWPVLVSYGLFSMWGVACFVMSLVLSKGGFGVDAADFVALGGVLVATLVGHILGNVLGLAGLRMMPIMILFVVAFTAASLSGALIGTFALFLIVGIFAALGGYLGIASRLDVVAAWFPLSFCVGGAMIWMNHQSAITTFRTGAKHAVWDGFSMICLSGGIFLMLVFLATRNALGLTVWQEVARPRGLPSSDEPVAVARPGRGTLFVLMLVTLAVIGVTALVSPYLFRTASADDAKDGDSKSESKQKEDSKKEAEKKDSKPSDGRDGEAHKGKEKEAKGGTESGSDGESSESNGEKKDGKGEKDGNGEKKEAKGDKDGDGQKDDPEDKPDDPLGKPDTDHAGEAAAEALAMGMKIFLWLLLIVLALLLLLAIFFPPMRRAFLMRHLERPLWPVAPTARVMNLWRRALAVLAVVDIEPTPGETPRDFARRAEQELLPMLGCDARGLSDAAAIVEKVDYAGRGLGAGDEQTMRVAVAVFVDTVSPRIGFGKKVAAAWVRTPEIES